MAAANGYKERMAALDSPDRLKRLRRHLLEGGAEVLVTDSDNLSQTIIGLIGERGWHRLVSVRRNRVGHPSVLGDDPPLEDDEVAQLDAVITESAVAAADPGLIVLDHTLGQGRPALVSIPPIHVCVVEEVQVVDDIDSALARLDPAHPTTWIAGPDAPSDLIAGLHRPASLVVVLVAQ